MARHNRTSPAEDFLAAMSRLPWWACVAVGAGLYLILHGIASQPFPTSVKPNEIGSAMTGSVFRALSMVGQYVVPILCIGAALMSYLGRRKRREIFLHTTEGGAFAARLDAMSWQDFELLLGEAFRIQGFAVTEKGGSGADGGVDLELTRHGERYLVQAKHWRAKQVPVEVVRELAGVMPFRRAAGAYVVTSGRFTQPATDFAQGRGIELVNGRKLEGMLAQARASLDEPGMQRQPRERSATAVAATPASACPTCGSAMTLRTASKGPNVGSKFWGCSTYPKCRGTRPV